VSRYLLDTSVFVAMEQGRPLGDAPEGTARISVATLTELTVGLHRATSPEKRAQRADTLEGARRFVPLAYDEDVSDRMAALLTAAKAAGRRFRHFDGMIAATALAHDCTVLTQDDDFDVLTAVEPALRVARI
jgi:predicted nucleic acid-binding protein